MTADRPRSLRGSVDELLAHARWALAMAWAANRPLLLGVAFVSLARAVVPAALAVTARGLVNATVAAIRGGSPTLVSVLPWLAAGLALTLLEGLSGLASRLFSQRLRDDLNYRITADILTHAATLDVAFYEDPGSQDMLQRAKDNPGDHVSGFVTNLIQCASNTVQIATLLAILLLIEPMILLVLVVFTIPYLRFQWRLAARHHALVHSRATKRRWTGYFVSSLTGSSTLGEVKLLRLAPLLIERFRSLMAEFRDQDRSLLLHGFTRSSAFLALTTVAFYAMFVRVAWRVLGGVLTLGDLAIFGGASTRLRSTLEGFVLAASGAMEETLYIANVVEFLQARPSVNDGPRTELASRRAEIDVRNVTFTYPGSREPALRDVSLHISPGETVALVGENGAGKTTLVKLIARLYDPDSGAILLDGVDVKELSRDALRSAISFVFQGFGRYEASAADNIAYGDWQRLLTDRDAVERIARRSGVAEMIAELPHGFDTMLGRTFGETELSGGQWQKLAVARAFARDAALLMLDEPTSNLDARAEHDLFVRFRALAQGRTTIIVSHRFSTVNIADRIIVLDKGRIVESGTHAELLARDGSYARMYAFHQRTMAAGVDEAPAGDGELHRR